VKTGAFFLSVKIEIVF